MILWAWHVPEAPDPPVAGVPVFAGPVERVQNNRPIFQTDLPPITPIIRGFDTQRGYCPQCREMARSRHPEQASTATGAAGPQIGPNAVALAADLKHRLGVSFCKIAGFLKHHMGIRVTPRGLVQACQRLARRAFTHAVLASLAATCHQRGHRLTDLAVSLLCPNGGAPPLSLVPAAPTS